VRIPTKRGDWVGVLAATPKHEPPKPVPLLKGTLATRTDAAGQTIAKVLLREVLPGPPDAAPASRLVIGKRYSEATLCNRPAVIAARELDPTSGEWRRTHARSLTSDDRRHAHPLFAKRLAEPIAADAPRLLSSRVASSAKNRKHQGLTDGDASTSWAEGVPGSGFGEFVVAHANDDVAIGGFQLILRPTGDTGEPSPRRAPATIHLVVDDELFAVTLPEDAWLQPAGTTYEVRLPNWMHTSCVGLVLGRAYDQGGNPDVTVAELRAITRFDGQDAIDQMVAALDAEPARATAAAALLTHQGDVGVRAVAKAFDGLSASGQARAFDVADAGSCAVSAPFLVERLLSHASTSATDAEVNPRARRARDRLRRCRTVASAELSSRIATLSSGVQLEAATRELAAIDPSGGAHTLVQTLERFDSTTNDDELAAEARRSLRAAIYICASSRGGRSALAAALAERSATLSQSARIDLLRALGKRAGAVEGAADAFAASTSNASFRTRYLLVQPAATLARNGNAHALSYLRHRIADTSPHVRAEAARATTGLAPLAPQLAEQLGDPGPRVRAAALEALSEISAPLSAASEVQMAQLLANDPWTFVRVAAASALARRPHSPESDAALLAALEDPSSLVRRTTLRSLGRRGHAAAGERVEEVANDAREIVAVRVAAIHTLGALCHHDAAPLLYKLALRAGRPQIQYDEALGLAALAALQRIHPPALRRELAPLLRAPKVPPNVRKLANDALRDPGVCAESGT